jgi:hypothetical protein
VAAAATESERGLLGVVVDRGWPARPYLYVHCTDGRNGHTIAISRFTLTGDLANSGSGLLAFDPASRYDLLNDLADDAPNHNGGTVRFGVDGRLYVSLGDDAKGCPAQDPTMLVGKILRLDVSRLPAGPGGPAPYALLTPAGNPWAADPDSMARLAWTIGLRNPFRFQVDPGTGALLIGDVGQNTWEELDVAANGGTNMGWPVREGPAAYGTCAPAWPDPFTEPVAWYGRTLGRSIIAGPRYRRPSSGAERFPADYDGAGFYLDYYNGGLRRITETGGAWAPAALVPGQPSADFWGTGFAATSDMIELADGTLWYCVQYVSGAATGEIRRIAYTANGGVPPSPPARLTLAPPWPSPTPGGATIAWAQPVAAVAVIAIHGLDGRLVRSLSSDAWSAGAHQVTWNGLDSAGHRVRPGIYVVRARVGSAERSARITVVR